MQARTNKSRSAAKGTSRDSSTLESVRARSGAANRHRQKQLEIQEALNPGGLTGAPGLTTRGSRLLLQKKSDYGKSASTTASPVVPSHVRGVLASPGRPLDRATRSFMEQRFSHDFNRVRVHDDGQAAESARTMSARAYTVGQDIAFAPGRYAPHSPAGRRLLAHELTHTIQQRGIQRSTGGISMPLASENQRYEQEADRAAAAIGTSATLPALSRAGLPTLQLDGPTYNIRLMYPPDHSEWHAGLSLVDALRVLTHFANLVDQKLTGSSEGHADLQAIHDDQYIVSSISDLAGARNLSELFEGGRPIPSTAIWTTPRMYLIQGRNAIRDGDVNRAARLLQQAAGATRAAVRRLNEYRNDTDTGAERAIFVLEVAQVAGAIAATFVTGGAASGVLVGAGYAGAQRLAREASSVHIGLQDEVDWAGIGIDMLFAVVAGRVGGGVGAVVSRGIAQLLGTRLVVRVTEHFVTNLLIGRGSALAHEVVAELFDAMRHDRAVSYEELAHRFAEQFSARAIALDLIGVALAGGAQALTPRPQGAPIPTESRTQPTAQPRRSAPSSRAARASRSRQPPRSERPSSRVRNPGRSRMRSTRLDSPTRTRANHSAPSRRTSTGEVSDRGTRPSASGSMRGQAFEGTSALDMRPAPQTQPRTRPVAVPALHEAPAPVPVAHAAPEASTSTITQLRPLPYSPASAAVAINAATGPGGQPPRRRKNKPTGRSKALDDAIPMVWCKLPEYYKRTIVVAGHVYKMDERRRLPHGEVIGVLDKYYPSINKVLSLVPEHRDPKVVEGFRKTLEEDYGFNWSGLQADHLQDVEWSGHDGWDNIWPIDSRHNLSAGPRQNQHQRLTYYADYDSPNPFVNIRLTTAKKLPSGQHVMGRYFKIRAITG